MSDEDNMNPFEILKISQAKGEECMKAILGVIGESRNGQPRLNMTAMNTVVMSNIAMNIMQIVISSLNHPDLLKTYKEQTLHGLNEYFDTQELKIKSTVN